MNTRFIGISFVTSVVLLVNLSSAQPPGERGRGPRDRQGTPRGPDAQRPDDRPRGPGGPDRRGPGGGQGRSRNPVVLALDADGDGELSPSEIARAVAALKTLDKNGDGNLSREEIRPADGGRPGPGRPDDRRPPQGDQQEPRRDGRLEGSRPDPPRQEDHPRSEAATAAPLSAPRKVLPSPISGFVGIPGGEFEMGDHHDLGGRAHRSDEVPIHTVRVDSFFIAKTETTNRQYCEFLNSALAKESIRFKEGLVYAADGGTLLCDTHQSDSASSIRWDGRSFAVVENRGNHPVVCIRWHGAAAYCNWLSEQQGREPCYDPATWKCDYTKNGFRLPTEAEWEYAARGGRYDQYTIFPWGNDADNSKANWPNSRDPFESGSLAWTTPVGFYNGSLQRKEDYRWPGEQTTYQTADGSNGYGLHDMSGNVWEWVNNWYQHDYYTVSPSDNPRGPEKGQPMRDGKPYRVLRSGSWYNGQWGHGRAANRNPSYYRGPDDPNHRWYHIGFRPVLPANEATVAPVARKSRKTVSNSSVSKTLGVLQNDPKAFEGYTLFAPKHYLSTYLMDNEGQIVHSWDSEYEPGQSVYLLPNGHLLHCCFTRNKGFTRGGEGGRLEEFDWDGNIVWEFEYSSDEHLSHHDIQPLPNGNVLVLAVEKKSYEECIAAGFDPKMLRDQQLFPEFIIEVEPTRPKGGKIVWEWHVWDHLIQDNDPAKDNFGDVAAHPERIDVDCNGRPVPAFWNHANSIHYNAELDQIVISARGCNEIWIIDHSTTTEEAAGSSGGRRGKGGDLLYRWGNPAAYGRSASEDRQLFQQHDAQWIPEGHPGAGNILIFNNGYDRGWSSVEEIAPPMDADGNYVLEQGKAYGPAEPVWRYQAEHPEDFFSSEVSGAHRLPDGNTLICAGVRGTFLEVTREGETVWKYVNPVVRTGALRQGELPGQDHRGHDWNGVFKIHRYAPDYPGLAGRDLSPKGLLTDEHWVRATQRPEREMPDHGPNVGRRPGEERNDRRPGGGRGSDERRGPGGRGGPRPR